MRTVLGRQQCWRSLTELKRGHSRRLEAALLLRELLGGSNEDLLQLGAKMSLELFPSR